MDEQDIFKRVSIINVKNKLGLEEKYANGDNILVNCPFCHQDYMRLNVQKDTYYCNNCGESGFAVGLYARLNYINNKKAFKTLINQKADMTTNLKEVRKATRKSDEEISIVYDNFLKLLSLTKDHYKQLLENGFSKEDIIQYLFKSIPQDEKAKVDLCNRLQKDGFDLFGIPGFYLNNKMKWTFNSHQGFFVPVIYHNKINGLRIHLEKEYRESTTDIWFSSCNKYQGSNAKNCIMILVPEQENKLALYNQNAKEGKNIIIASEMLLAYRLYKQYNKITIGIPNTISKKQADTLVENLQIKQADIFLDKHTISTNAAPIYNNLLSKIDDNRKNIKMILKDNEVLPSENRQYKSKIA